MAEPATRRLAALSAAAIFLGAFLLFQVQPIIGKMILPWFGGSPAVWTTAMLFFQTMLLAGYLYAHLAAHLAPRWSAALHLALLAAALATLPIVPGSDWKPPDGAAPVARILALLTVCVGLPYLLLAATSPLIQAWLARLAPGRPVYRLYALSNVGSLGALLSYPVLIEPLLSTDNQGWIWSAGLAAYAVVCAALAAVIWRSRSTSESAGAPAAKIEPEDSARPTVGRWLVWLAAPALASMMLLTITHHLCQDIAVVPFLWIVPLSLYLVTFIIAFERDAWYSRHTWAAGAFFCVLAVSLLGRAGEIQDYYEKMGVALPLKALQRSALVQAAAHLALLFFLCMVCHGETARARPAPRWLTLFYLTIAAGGAVGGALSALVFPRVFPDYWELRLGIMAGFALSVLLLGRELFRQASVAQNVAESAAAKPSTAPRKAPRRGKSKPASPVAAEAKHEQAASRRTALWLGGAIALVGAFVVGWSQIKAFTTTSLRQERNFYGVLRVEEVFADEPEHHGRVLFHGRIMHGYQLLDPQRRDMPTAYFHRDSGVGLLMRTYPRKPRRVGIIGLGAGALAAYAEPGDVFRFYEINPLVIEYAQEHFTFLKDCRADRVDIVPGDARISLEGEEPQDYDILVIDAFSGDAIPTHLLTREAMEQYVRHLRHGGHEGALAFHISNRYVELRPVVAALAEEAGFRSLLISDSSSDRMTLAASDWALLSNDRQMFSAPELQGAASPLLEAGAKPVLWTDRFSNLLGALK